MLELGELESHHEEFKQRGVQVVVVSNDDLETAKLTQEDFPHLIVVSDAEQNIAKSLQVIHPKMGPKSTDTNAPTTILTDGKGQVRWFFRPQRFIERLPPEELLKAIDEHLRAPQET